MYADSITSVSHDGRAGDLAVVFDDKRRFAAIGLWDPDSPIRLRVLHAGSPRPIDDSFWRQRLADAIEVRRPLLDDEGVTGLRLVHGENDGLPALVVDRYDTVLVVKAYSAAWTPWLAAVIDVLVAIDRPTSVVLRWSRNLDDRARHGLADGAVVWGAPLTEPVPYRENGLRALAHPCTGQKTGAFLDQRDNRARVRDLALGAAVLDVFCCTGGFSVHAAAGGARSVHSVDIAGPAVEVTEAAMAANAALPEVAACEHTTAADDAFAAMAALASTRRRFDLVVVDPPSFASRAADVDRARRAYTRLTHLALDLLPPGGILVQASCSSRVADDDFHDGIHAAARRAGRHLAEIARTGHALDHPVGFAQGAYLKAMFATVDP